MARNKWTRVCPALVLCTFLLAVAAADPCAAAPLVQQENESETATASIQFPDHSLNISLAGLYAIYSDYSNFAGVAVRATEHQWPKHFADGCVSTQYAAAPNDSAWIAVAFRSNCTFIQKTAAAALAGASGLIIVDNIPKDDILLISGDPGNAPKVPTVATTYGDGLLLLNITAKDPTMIIAVVVTSRPDKAFVGFASVILNNAIFFFGAMMATVFAAVMAFGIRTIFVHRAAKTAREDLARRVQEQLNQITTRPYDVEKDRTEEGDSSHDQCAICIQDYDNGDTVRELPCEHLFHQTCVDPWLLEHSECPLCKRSVLPQEETSEIV